MRPQDVLEPGLPGSVPAEPSLGFRDEDFRVEVPCWDLFFPPLLDKNKTSERCLERNVADWD